ncbi:hypothetical protein EC957_002920 [Mortierella hygrophila]|uniref:BZIP domain-containing protein n=1 Tax=Mortierella hygrophila TaxID=979708 RepID=A0A9P6K1L5_9FUNG|nr:hypothetical protein EC957_002920 [Mortierella hygrophila]
MFDDFIELDLLDASDPANAMFASFYLGDTADIDDSDYNIDNSNNLAPTAAVDSLPVVATADSDTTADSSLGLVIKQEPSDSPMLLNPIPLSPQQTLASDESPLIFDTDMTLITPDQLTIAPQATTVSPSSLSSSTSPTISTAAAAASASATAATTATQSTVAIDSSKLHTSTATTASSSTANKSTSSSTPTAKRTSPEPASTPARKHAKTESVSSSTTSSKAKSSSASKKSSSSASTTYNAAATTKVSSGASKSTASTSTSATSSSITASKGKTQTPEPTPESLTSTANTTLSAATLQFLLQQQVETPLIPQLFTGKLSREEIEETLARLLESTKYLIPSPDEEALVKIKEEPASEDESDNEMEGVEPTTEGAEPSHGLKTQPGIKTDDIPSSTDLKKMTSKERRQLRNKISARNFRVRRKEYIYTLEGQVLLHKTEARHLREAVTLMQDENQRLKDELEVVRRQLEATTMSTSSINPATIATTSTDPTLAPEPSTPLSKENQSLLTSIMNRNVNAAMNPNAKSNITLSMARPQSPILTPNLHKDVPNSSSGSASQSSWKDKNPIMVHRTLIPEICFGDEFQFDNKPSGALDADMMDRPWMTFDLKPAEPQLSGASSFTVSELVLELMQTFTCMSANLPSMTVAAVEESVVEANTNAEADAEADLDWELQQNLWALTQVDDMTEDQIQLVYDLVHCQTSSSRPSSPAQEDPNMLEWLYESMMARLVDLDLQGSQDNTLPESHMA